MNVLDPGHKYEVQYIDCPLGCAGLITFVKREGEGYPGNTGSYAGTQIQELLRVLIDRTRYLHNQKSHWINPVCTLLYRTALNLLELRAAYRHARDLHWYMKPELIPISSKDGHWKD